MDKGAWWATVHGGRKKLDTTDRLHFHFPEFKWPEDSCVCVLVAQLYPTLCNPMDCTLPGSSVHGIL